MNKILYLISFVLVMAGCTKSLDEYPSDDSSHNGQYITIHFGINNKEFEYGGMRSGMAEDSKVNTLQLWVFDAHGLFVDACDATLDSDGKTFHCEVPQLNDKYIIHFIGNAKIDAATAAIWRGKNENEVVPQYELKADKDTPPPFTFWTRCEYPSLHDGQVVDEIYFIHNVAKYTLTVHPDIELKDVEFKLVNAPGRESVAPFDPKTRRFIIPSRAADGRDNQGDADRERINFNIPNSEMPLYDEKNYLSASTDDNDPNRKVTYSFERNNIDEDIPDNEHTVMIIKGKYEGKECYYKIEFVRPNREDVRFQLYRNNWYDVHIRHVFGLGYPTEEAAKNGIAANAFTLSSQIYVYRNFSMGRGELELDRTYYIFTPDMMNLIGNKFDVQANYYEPDTQVKNNGRITIPKKQGAIVDYDITGNTVKEATVNANGAKDGIVHISLNDFNQITKLSDVTIQVNEDPFLDETGKLSNPYLKRKIRVEVHKPYQYTRVEANTASSIHNEELSLYEFPKEMEQELNLTLKLPKAMSDRALPIKFELICKNFHFYPDDPYLVSDYEPGVGMHYYFILSTMPEDRKLHFKFKSNTDENADRFVIKCWKEYLPGKWGELYEEQTININN